VLNGLDGANSVVLIVTLLLLAMWLVKFGFIDAGRIVIILLVESGVVIA